MIWTVFIFLALLSILVIAHELGHFWMARRSGMQVEEFGVGFPPRLFSFVRRGTVYSFNLIPLGGFVKIQGENGEHIDDPKSFASKSRRARFLVLIGGVAMNVLLTIILLFVGSLFGMPAILHDLPASARVRDAHVAVVDLVKGSPAELAGVRSGDKLVSLNGTVFATAEEAHAFIKEMDASGEFVLARGDTSNTYTLSKQIIPGFGDPVIGVGLEDVGLVSYPFFESFIRACVGTYRMILGIFVGLWTILSGLVGPSSVPEGISGPVGIAIMSGDMARLGFSYLIQFGAILSANLAVLNILPIPALDGGRILFLLIEAVIGRPIKRGVEVMIHNLGFLALMGLVLFVTFQDVRGLLQSMFS